MALSGGDKLGPYEIQALIGEGGMGEVYRVRDTRLERTVALKVSKEQFNERFEREARAIASLNHPNISQLYDIGPNYLVMEYVDGPMLSERISDGPLPWEDAISIARQIAEALEYAHDRGIVHRDLKPANVKITPDGTVKVLDFGLAKATGGSSVLSSDPRHSPTMTLAATEAGVILGTAAYMSPEQARGKSVDKRTDIWAFGVVLFEILTARRAFEGETVSDTLAAVLRGEPRWELLPPEVPATLRGLLLRCIDKDARHRLRDVGEARIALETVSKGSGAEQAGPTPSARRSWLPWAIAATLAIAVAAAGLLLWRESAKPAATVAMRFALTLPPGAQLVSFDSQKLAIAPDGQSLAYTAGTGGESSRLYVRPLDSFESKAIPGTDGAADPFYSPDGQWIGFFAEGKLKKVPVKVGAPAILADAPNERGASWGPDDTIVFSPDYASGLMRVPASGGKAELLISPDASKGERSYRWPQILPDGDSVLYSIGTLNSPGFYDNGPIAVASLKTKQSHVVLEGASMARYTASGDMVYAHGGALYTVRFDPGKVQKAGFGVPLLEGVDGDVGSGVSFFSISNTGILAYIASLGAQGGPEGLVSIDRTGASNPVPLPLNIYKYPRYSPDGKRLAVTLGQGTGSSENDIAIYEAAENRLWRLTFGGGNFAPAWSRDGKWVTYVKLSNAGAALYRKPSDGSGSEELLTEVYANPAIAGGWSPGDKEMVFVRTLTTSRNDVYVYSAGGAPRVRPFIQTPWGEFDPSFSPDGHWVLYASDESGRAEIYVQAYPGPGGKWQISSDGGREPVWAGKEILFLSGDKMMSATVKTEPTFSAAAPRMLFKGGFSAGTGPGIRAYDASPDGQRFVMVPASKESGKSNQINIVLNWFDEMNRHSATGPRQ